MNYFKKAYSVLITIIVMIIFSTIITLGLKLSSLQLETSRSSFFIQQSLEMLDNLNPFMMKIIREKKSICLDRFDLIYEDYEINNTVTYLPQDCNPVTIGNNSFEVYMMIQSVITNKNNDISYNKIFYHALD